MKHKPGKDAWNYKHLSLLPHIRQEPYVSGHDGRMSAWFPYSADSASGACNGQGNLRVRWVIFQKEWSLTRKLTNSLQDGIVERHLLIEIRRDNTHIDLPDTWNSDSNRVLSAFSRGATFLRVHVYACCQVWGGFGSTPSNLLVSELFQISEVQFTMQSCFHQRATCDQGLAITPATSWTSKRHLWGHASQHHCQCEPRMKL